MTDLWMDDAACLGLDTDLFFPHSDKEVWPEIAAVCGACEVRDRCLQTALERGIWHGIWGGLSPDQRRKAAREAGMPRHGTLTGYTKDGCRCRDCRTAMTEHDRSKRPRKAAS